MSRTNVGEPLVSIVVPTWNRLSYLREAVASVLGQSYPRWELIVVDDGSTDGTAEWIRGLADPRITLLERPHSGNLARVRNAGNAVAKGDLIALLDSDDLFEPKKIERQVAALAANPECGWSYTAVSRIDGAGAAIDPGPPFLAISGRILARALCFDALLATPTLMVRAALLGQVGPFDEGLDECQDYELFFRLAAASPTIAIDERLTRVRIHTGAMSTDRTRVNEAWVVVYDRFAARAPDPVSRRISQRLAREHRLGSASWRVRRGEPRRALAHVLEALRRQPWSPRVWKALLAEVGFRGLLLPLLRSRGRSRPGVPGAPGPPPPEVRRP
jgi:glycosyltransferase involved in cell wall biosynthesis